MSKAYLILANGRVFEGERFGADCDSTGELVFTTGAGGYVETLTDPRYRGQIIMQTFPLIGNYGWISGDNDTDNCVAAGYIVRDWCDAPSNFRCEGDIDAYLKAQGIPGLCGVDTREITQIIREEGTMAACISQFPDVKLNEFTVMKAVVCKKRVYLTGKEAVGKVVVVSFGALDGVVSRLNGMGYDVTVLPYFKHAETILAERPDGVIFSGGCGDPHDYSEAVDTAKQLMGAVPVFGYGLGHQLMALAMGGSVEKLKFGHRGANQPVKDIESGRILITNQNHGYAVVADSVTGGKISHINLNDNTCEGLEYPDKTAFSVQFKPEQAQFERFIKLMGGND